MIDIRITHSEICDTVRVDSTDGSSLSAGLAGGNVPAEQSLFLFNLKSTDDRTAASLARVAFTEAKVINPAVTVFRARHVGQEVVRVFAAAFGADHVTAYTDRSTVYGNGNQPLSTLLEAEASDQPLWEVIATAPTPQ